MATLIFLMAAIGKYIMWLPNIDKSDIKVLQMA